MHRGLPYRRVADLGVLIWAVSSLACSDDSMSPERRRGFIEIAAWACPDTPDRGLTFAKCVRDGESFDPRLADVPGRLSVLTVLARPERPESPHRIVATVIVDGTVVDSRIFPPMNAHQGLRDVLSDTVSILPLPDVEVDVVLELAEGERIPFLTLVADTTLHWE